MQLEKVSIEDIYPDDKNPRKDFGDIKALAESFELNTLNPGEPVNPIVVVRDGGICRIVDGERRYHAMKHNKLAVCNAVVCEDMDEANAQIAMLTTNDKQPLTPLEISRGVQQQLLLGVDPIKVEKSARMKPGTASKVATARALIDDAAEDMTLDRMLAIEEFADDPEAVEKLTNCRENEWERLADNIRMERRDKKRWDGIESALLWCGIPLVEETDEYHTQYVRRIDSAKELENIISNQDNHTFLQNSPTGVRSGYYQAVKASYGVGVVVYMVPDEEGAEEIDPEEEARKQHLDDLEAAVSEGSEARIIWFAERLKNLDSMPNITESIKEYLFEEGEYYNSFSSKLEAFEKGSQQELPRELNATLAAYGYTQVATSLRSWSIRDILDKKELDNQVFKYICWISAFQDDGFSLNQGELELIQLYEAYLKTEEAEDGQNQ